MLLSMGPLISFRSCCEQLLTVCWRTTQEKLHIWWLTSISSMMLNDYCSISSKHMVSTWLSYDQLTGLLHASHLQSLCNTTIARLLWWSTNTPLTWGGSSCSHSDRTCDECSDASLILTSKNHMYHDSFLVIVNFILHLYQISLIQSQCIMFLYGCVCCTFLCTYCIHPSSLLCIFPYLSVYINKVLFGFMKCLNNNMLVKSKP